MFTLSLARDAIVSCTHSQFVRSLGSERVCDMCRYLIIAGAELTAEPATVPALSPVDRKEQPSASFDTSSTSTSTRQLLQGQGQGQGQEALRRASTATNAQAMTGSVRRSFTSLAPSGGPLMAMVAASYDGDANTTGADGGGGRQRLLQRETSVASEMGDARYGNGADHANARTYGHGHTDRRVSVTTSGGSIGIGSLDSLPAQSDVLTVVWEVNPTSINPHLAASGGGAFLAEVVDATRKKTLAQLHEILLDARPELAEQHFLYTYRDKPIPKEFWNVFTFEHLAPKVFLRPVIEPQYATPSRVSASGSASIGTGTGSDLTRYSSQLGTGVSPPPTTSSTHSSASVLFRPTPVQAPGSANAFGSQQNLQRSTTQSSFFKVPAGNSGRARGGNGGSANAFGSKQNLQRSTTQSSLFNVTPAGAGDSGRGNGGQDRTRTHGLQLEPHAHARGHSVSAAAMAAAASSRSSAGQSPALPVAATAAPTGFPPASQSAEVRPHKVGTTAKPHARALSGVSPDPKQKWTRDFPLDGVTSTGTAAEYNSVLQQLSAPANEAVTVQSSADDVRDRLGSMQLKQHEYAVALYVYERIGHPDHLTCAVGDLLVILRRDNEQWWYCELCKNKTRGWVPVSYVQVIPKPTGDDGAARVQADADALRAQQQQQQQLLQQQQETAERQQLQRRVRQVQLERQQQALLEHSHREQMADLDCRHAADRQRLQELQSIQLQQQQQPPHARSMSDSPRSPLPAVGVYSQTPMDSMSLPFQAAVQYGHPRTQSVASTPPPPPPPLPLSPAEAPDLQLDRRPGGYNIAPALGIHAAHLRTLKQAQETVASPPPPPPISHPPHFHAQTQLPSMQPYAPVVADFEPNVTIPQQSVARPLVFTAPTQTQQPTYASLRSAPPVQLLTHPGVISGHGSGAPYPYVQPQQQLLSSVPYNQQYAASSFLPQATHQAQLPKVQVVPDQHHVAYVPDSSQPSYLPAAAPAPAESGYGPLRRRDRAQSVSPDVDYPSSRNSTSGSRHDIDPLEPTSSGLNSEHLLHRNRPRRLTRSNDHDGLISMGASVPSAGPQRSLDSQSVHAYAGSLRDSDRGYPASLQERASSTSYGGDTSTSTVHVLNRSDTVPRGQSFDVAVSATRPDTSTRQPAALSRSGSRRGRYNSYTLVSAHRGARRSQGSGAPRLRSSTPQPAGAHLELEDVRAQDSTAVSTAAANAFATAAVPPVPHASSVPIAKPSAREPIVAGSGDTDDSDDPAYADVDGHLRSLVYRSASRTQLTSVDNRPHDRETPGPYEPESPCADGDATGDVGSARDARQSSFREDIDADSGVTHSGTDEVSIDTQRKHAASLDELKNALRNRTPVE